MEIAKSTKNTKNEIAKTNTSTTPVKPKTSLRDAQVIFWRTSTQIFQSTYF